jgi:ubiquinone biosynthesis accessory factor UbiK
MGSGDLDAGSVPPVRSPAGQGFFRGAAHVAHQHGARIAQVASRRGAISYTIRYPLITTGFAMAFDPRLIDDLARRLAGSVPESVVALRRDLEQNFKGVLQGQLARLDLVTREEFDVQAAVLKRTRAKLAALEKRLGELEEKG